MKLQLIVAAIALWSGINFANHKENTVLYSETLECANIQMVSSKMTPETERILIELYARPHWNLSSNQAWEEYADQIIVLEQLEADIHYIIHRSGQELDVILDLE